jgi:hypothetical protein
MTIWSFSDSRTFRKCQRQWFYKTHVASPKATKDPVRHEAYLLSRLQSVAAWRGSLVDHVISSQIVRSIKNKWDLNPTRIMEYAKTTFDQQLDFARQHRLRESGMSPAKTGNAFAALYAVEYGLELTEAEIATAWADVRTALINLLEMSQLLGLLRSAKDLIPQRTLTFSHYEATVRAVPDLIAFYDSRAPLIVDWKVHAFGSIDYRLQLACYAIALTRTKLQKDFPAELAQYDATDIQLLEVQLLTQQQREYVLSKSDVEEADAFIVKSSAEMALALGDQLYEQASPFDLPVTDNPETCQRCSFRRLCWKEPTSWDLKQMSFL